LLQNIIIPGEKKIETEQKMHKQCVQGGLFFSPILDNSQPANNYSNAELPLFISLLRWDEGKVGDGIHWRHPTRVSGCGLPWNLAHTLSTGGEHMHSSIAAG